MKIRLRRALERIASSEDARRDRAEEALRELDRGEVTTIHSFCLALLRERPFEAGIDPDFVQLDPAASTELASRVWNDWWKGEIAQRPGGAIAQSLRRGLAVGRVEEEKALVRLANGPRPLQRANTAGRRPTPPRRSCGNAAAPRIVEGGDPICNRGGTVAGRGCDRLPARHPRFSRLAFGFAFPGAAGGPRTPLSRWRLPRSVHVWTSDRKEKSRSSSES